MDLEKFRAEFRRPGREDGPTPFFALNDELEPDRLRAALRVFADAGCAGVFMHPRTGLTVPYLSEEFWARIGVILEESRRLGITAWIYDEYNWPSGVAGGRVLDSHPEFRMPYLEYAFPRLHGETELEHPGRAVAAFAVGNQMKNLSEHIRDGRFFPPPDFFGELLLFYEDVVTDRTFATNHAPWCSGVQGYLDLMNPDAVRAFMQLTHAEYARRFSDYFGSTIPGLFTDEPQFYRGLPWTSRFAEIFRERNGYDLLERLFMLVLDRGDFRQARCDYYETVERLYAESFYAPVRSWCDEHGLIFTGHLGMEERLSQLALNHGGIYRPLKTMTMPGIDALGDGNPEIGGLINMESPDFSPRAAAAISRLHGNGRVLCEAGGGGGWEVTPFRLKRQLDWLFASGVNFINPHQSLLSVKGLRKRDFPPSQFVQEPWFEYFRLHAEYIARLSRLTSLGEPIMDIALLAPLAALRATQRPRGAGISQEAERALIPLNSIMGFLIRNQRDFELVFEAAAQDGKITVADDRLVVGSRSFQVLIVPPGSVLQAGVAAVLARFLEAGGRVLFFDRLPEWDSQGQDLTAELLAPFRQAAAAGRAIQLSSQQGFSREGVLAALDRLCHPDLTVAAPFQTELIYQHRRIEGADFYFLANLGDGAGPATIRFREAKPCLEKWDPVTGEAKRWPREILPEGGAAVQVNFSAGESMVLAFFEGAEEGVAIKTTNLAPLEWIGNRFKGFTVESRAVVETAREKIEREGAAPPLPIVLAPNWEIEPERPNLFLLEPWDARTDHTQPLPLAGLAAERYFTARTRRVIKVARAIIGALSVFRPLERRYRTERYFNFAESERALRPVSRVTGIALERWGLYEGTDALSRFSDYLGFRTLMRTFPPPGAPYVARAEFFAEAVPDDLALVYEDLGVPIEFEINGMRVTDTPEPRKVWDDCNRVLPVSRLMRLGKNRVVMKSRQLEWYAGPPNTHTLEPVALIGSFGVKGRKLTAPARGLAAEGDSRERGYPYYSGALRFKRKFELPAEYLSFHLVLELGDVRECAEVWVNGRPAGARIYPPFSYPVSGLCREGENELEVRVVNTAANLFSRPLASGLLGVIRIAPFAIYEVELAEG